MKRALWVTMLLLAIPPDAALAQGRGFFAAMSEERKVLSQFDKDGDKVLNAAERKEALATLSAQGGGGAQMRGMFGGNRVVNIQPGPSVAVSDVKPVAASVPFYDNSTVRTVFLEFEDAEWLKELITFNNTDIEVPAMMTIDGRVYRDVGVQTRGASSFMMVPEGQKLSLKLSLNSVNKDQRVLGLKTLNLLNSHEDPSFLRTVLYNQIAREYLPSPRANFVRVVINGESWGAYVNAEVFNKEFVESHFKATDGRRWKVTGSPDGRGGLEYLGDDPAPYRNIYDLKTKEEPKAWADLINLTKVLNTTPPDQLEKALTPIMDVDAVLRFLALDVALVNNDGFWVRASDYNMYQNAAGRFTLIPHDVNESFTLGSGGFRGPPGGGFPGGGARGGGPPGGGPPGGPPPGGGRGGRGGGGGGGGGFMMGGNTSLDPLVGMSDTTTKALRARMLAVPALREKYLGYVRDIATRWLDWKTLGPIVQHNHDLIAAIVPGDTRKLDSTEEFEAGVETLKKFAEQRRAFLLEWKEPE